MIRDYAEFNPASPTGLWKNAHYEPAPDVLSVSSAKVLLGQRPPARSGALDFGKLAHTALLEPHKLDAYVALDPAGVGVKADGSPADKPTSTTAWKKAVDEVEKVGKTVIQPAALEKALAMASAVRKHPAAARLLEAATDFELLAYAVHESGVMVRGVIDACGGGALVDYKSAMDGDPEWFGRTAYKNGYYLQAAVYQYLAEANGLAVDTLRFIVCEKEPNLSGDYRVSVVYLDEFAIEQGQKDFAEACQRWLALGRVDLPDYPDHEVCVGLPAYAYDDMEVDLKL